MSPCLKGDAYYKFWALVGALIQSGVFIWSWALIRAFTVFQLVSLLHLEHIAENIVLFFLFRLNGDRNVYVGGYIMHSKGLFDDYM